MPNAIDTPIHREVLASRNTEEFLRASAQATFLTIIVSADKVGLERTIQNCEFSSLSAAIIWLQTRGVIIPADILSHLQIEDVRYA